MARRCRQPEKFLELVDGAFYPFTKQNADIRAAWKEETCVFCGVPAVGLVVGFLKLDDCPNLMENPGGTPEQQASIDTLYAMHPDANFYMPVCESHADGEPQ